jgi:threonine/homoserine/homoserine lactone efflux protein
MEIDVDPVSAVLAFTVAAALLTITPGLDTALVLRTATVEGAGEAMAAGAGIVVGVLAWGLLASLGIGAMLAASEIGYRVLQTAGAAYLVWLGSRMFVSAVFRAASEQRTSDTVALDAASRGASSWFWRGLMTNLLNPKVGVFYVSLLPQFIPAGVPAAVFGVGLATIHAVMGIVWFAAITLATRPFSRLLRRPAFIRSIDSATGSVLIAFGVKLALQEKP